MTTSFIRRFNTHETPDDAIISLQTGRNDIRQQILETVQHNLQTGQRQLQHILVRAPRGFGKSYMTRLTEIDTRDLTTAGASVRYALLPEEQRNVSSPASLLKEIRRIVTGEGWEQVTSMWDDDEDAWGTAVADLDLALDEIFAPNEGLLIAVIENLDHLIKDVFKTDADQQALRKWFTRKGNRIMIFATATGSVDLDYDKPIFHALEEIHLTPWSEDDCIDYFKALRKFKKQPELDNEQIAKARAISGFIGGNPRLARLLGDVLTTEDVMSVAATLDGLVDELADYYRRRIDDLTAKAKTLLDALIRGGEPCSQSELAQRVGTQQNRIARAFAELLRNQIVVGRKAAGSRENLYQVTDRVFVHFYRTRYGGVARDDSPLLAITDLLKTFFSTDEKRQQASQFLNDGMLKEGRLMADLAIAEQGLRSDAYYNSYFDNFPNRFSNYLLAVEPIDKKTKAELEQAISNLDSPEKAFNVSQTALSSDLSNGLQLLWLILSAVSAAKLGLTENALSYFSQAISKAADIPKLVCISYQERGLFFEHIMEDRAAAVNDLTQSGQQAEHITQPTLKIYSLKNKAYALTDNFTERALSIYRQAFILAKKINNKEMQANILRLTAFILQKLNRYGEALNTGRKAYSFAEKIDDKLEQTWTLWGITYASYRLNRFEEAVKVGNQVVALAKEINDKANQAQPLRFIALSLKALNRQNEALDSIRAGLACIDETSLSLNDERFHQAWLISELLDSATKIAIPDCITQFAKLLSITQSNTNEVLPKPFDLLLILFQAATRAKQWPALITLWQQEKNDFEKHIEDWLYDDPGYLLNEIIKENDPAEAYACAADFILALAPEIKGESEAILHSTHPEGIVKDSLQYLLANCEAADFLSNIADLLASTFTSHFSREIDLLKAAATYHQANRDPAALARVDPDISTALIRMWDREPISLEKNDWRET